jgi:N-acetylmuramoyl-L-alanine amidase
VECGFLSNAEDERLLVTPEWQKKLSSSIVAGLMDYFSLSSS